MPIRQQRLLARTKGGKYENHNQEENEEETKETRMRRRQYVSFKNTHSKRAIETRLELGTHPKATKDRRIDEN